MPLIHDLDGVNRERARLLHLGQLKVTADQLDGDAHGFMLFTLL